MSIKASHISCAIIFFCSVANISIYGQNPAKATGREPSIRAVSDTTQILTQLNDIDCALEEAAHHLCSKRTKKAKNRLSDIRYLRDFIRNVQTASFAQAGTEDLPLLLAINNTLLKQFAITLKKRPNRVDRQLLEDLRSNKSSIIPGFSTTVNKRAELISKHKTQLKTLRKKTHECEFTPFNLFTQKITKRFKGRKLDQALPWIALAGLYFCLPEAGPGKIGGGTGAGGSKDADGAAAKSYSFMRNFVKVNVGALVTIEMANIIGEPVYENIKDMAQWIGTQGKRALCYASGKPFEADNIIVSKTTLDDVQGFSHAKKALRLLTDSFSAKSSTLSEDDISHGYLFVGPSGVGTELMNGVAGEIHTAITKKNSRAECGVYTVHSSRLLDKPIKEIVDEAKNFAVQGSICIIVIEELDWLYHLLQKDPNAHPELWAGILHKLMPIVKKSKKSLYVAATIGNSNLVAPIAKDFGFFGTTTIYLGTPSKTDRHAYFTDYLQKHALNPNTMPIGSWVYQTEGCSIEMLQSVMKKAFAHAHQESTTLRALDVEYALDIVVHGITYNADTASEGSHLRAAHIAGKAVAHVLQLPEVPLIKATTFTINTAKKSERGGLITPLIDSERVTTALMEKNCIVELAGTVAEQILHGTFSIARYKAVEHTVYKQMQQIYFSEENQTVMPQQVKEETLNGIWNTIHSWKTLAYDILTAHKAALNKIAERLSTDGIISRSSIDGIMADLSESSDLKQEESKEHKELTEEEQI